ncbi:DUF2989 domain-containing protein [Alteromonas sp. ASW11-36]|uniref:DUF2989 domain-containing protein n=1 Tax=Alteromonas arenosi TaxID=3055817 RepID=A0ABT7SYK4_9ALTE|nr:DUF2989 domain-containing protein [Alteromonas sp. ASW11-36]MDM7860609.1 DUF2989 domain-containing protein [Alteromonas sp. ASW11-36]
MKNLVSVRYFPTFILVLITLLTLSGCDGFAPRTVAQMCEENPEICNDLNPDYWCRAEKADIIKHRYDHLNEMPEKAQYDLLLMFESYKTCIDKAAQIRHIKLREKESGRMKGALTAQRELQRLSRATRDSNNPYLAYYQWSRHGHEDALRRFLAHQKAGRLNSPALQVGLASYYAKIDTGHAINALYTALSLYTDDDAVDPEIFISLYTLHQQRDEIERAVLWGYVGSEYEENDVDVSELAAIATQAGLDLDKVQREARRLYDRIESGDFNFSS